MFVAIGLASAHPEGLPKFVSSLIATAAPASPGSNARIIVKVSIPAGYHIQANPASKDMIPTVVTAVGPHGFLIGKAVYPPGLVRNIAGMSVRVYEGTATVQIPITIPKTELPGKYSVKIGIQAQGCDDRACYRPVQFTTDAVVTVDPFRLGKTTAK